MRHRAAIPGLLLLLAAAVAGPSTACGDKFLVAGRGARFQRRGPRAMSVVVYAPASSSLAAGHFGKAPVEAVLTRGGYRPATAASPEQLTEALRSGKADIVLADAADARTVESAAPSGAPRPTVVPVLDNATRQEVAEARKEWGVALRSPASGDALLDAVDAAAELRAKGTRTAP